MKLTSFCKIIFSSVILFSAIALYSEKLKPIQLNVRSGVYVPQIQLSLKDLKTLPVPSSNEDYAMMQQIDREMSIVIGAFSGGERKITLIQDKDFDGKADLVAYWLVDQQKFKVEENPDKVYPAEKIKKLKEDIINGSQDEIRPNNEGVDFMRKFFGGSENVKKWRNGFRVVSVDSDNKASERLVFSFSYNKLNGADMVFEVKYRNRGVARVSPIINYGVYCSNTKDPYVIELVKKLTKEAMEKVN